MPISDHNKGLLTGIAVALGAVGAAKVFGKPLTEAARPLAKAGVRSLLEARDKGAEWVAEAGETLSDIVAEVRAEREAERAATMAAVRTPAGSTGGNGGGA